MWLVSFSFSQQLWQIGSGTKSRLAWLSFLVFCVVCGLHLSVANGTATEGEGRLLARPAQGTCVQSYNEAFELYQKNSYPEALAKFNQALSCYRNAAQREGMAESLRMIGEVNRLLRNFPESISGFQSALQYYTSKQVVNPLAEAETYRLLAWAYFDSGDYSQAVENFNTALEKYSILVNPDGKARSYFGLGLSYINNDDCQSAIAAFRQAAALFDTLKNPERRLDCGYYVGKCQYELEQHDEAIRNLKSFIQSSTESTKLANSYFWLGNIYFQLERYSEAREAFTAAKPLFQRLDKVLVAHCYYNIGLSYFNEESWVNAVTNLGSAASEYTSMADYKSVVSSLIYVGHANYNLSRYPVASQAYLQAAELARQHGFPSEEAEILERLGATYAAQDRLNEAAAAYREAGHKYDSLGRRIDAIAAYQQEGNIHLRLDQPDSAMATYRRVIRLASGPPVLRRPSADSHFKLGEVLRGSGQPVDALHEYEEALSLYRDLTARADTLAMCLDGLGHCNFDRQFYAEAASYFTEAASLHTRSGAQRNAALAHYNAGSSYDNLIKRDHDAVKQYQLALHLYEKIDLPEKMADAQARIASVQVKLENPGLALKHFRAALDLYRDLPDTAGMAQSLCGIGDVYSRLDPKDPEKAESSYMRGEELYMSIGDPLGWAVCHQGLASVHFELELWSQSLREYRQAAETFERHNRPDKAALCFYNAGIAAYNHKDYSLSLSLYHRALDYYQGTDKRDEAAQLNKQIGDSYLAKFELDKARSSYESGLEMYVFLQDAEGIFRCSIGLGDVYFRRGQYMQARSRYEEALSKISSHLGLDLEAVANNRLAETAVAVGEFDQAVTHLNRSRDIYGELGKKENQLETLTRLGQLSYQRDQYQQALEYYNQVYDNTNNADLATSRRAALINKGNVYHEVGNHVEATTNFEEALHLSRAAGDSAHVSASLTGLGNVLVTSENPDYAEAEVKFKEVLTIAEKQNEALDIARALLNLGNVYNGWRQNQLAYDHYVRAKVISEQENFTQGVAISYNNIGIVESNRGSNPVALENFQRAEEKAQEIYMRRLRITAYSNKGVIYEKMARYEDARTAYGQAIKLVEEIRGGFKRKDDLFNSYVESTADLYDRMITLLFELGDDSTAYNYIVNSVSLNLIEIYKKNAEASGNTELIKRLSNLEELIKQKRKAQETIETFVANNPREKIPDPLVQNLAETTYEVERLEQQLIAQYQDYSDFREIREAMISRIRHRIPPGAVLVTYYPSKERLYVFIASRERHSARSVNISRKDLYDKINLYRTTLQEQRDIAITTKWNLQVNHWQDQRVLPLVEISTELHRYLIRPLIDELEQAQTVIFMPTGQLSYLPLHALANQLDSGKLRFVIEDWRVGYLTPATFTTTSSRYRNSASMAECRQDVYALGYSIGSEPLPGVHREMESLKRFAPSANIYLDQAATVAQAVEASRKSCVFIVSSHVTVNQLNTDLSCFVLADGPWFLGNIRKHQKPGDFNNMMLAIFPNCETALGERDPRFGVHNLVYAFSQYGTASIMATLWKVSDYFTPYLMDKFYRNLFDRDMDKVESLRQAQIDLLQNPTTRHPFLWAAFLIYGYALEDVELITRK